MAERRRRWRRTPLAIALLLAAAGLWQLGGGLWIEAKARLAQVLIARAWAAADAVAPPPPWPWADTRPVARLTVPELGIDQIVLAGASGRTLAFGPGHLDGTAAPGAQGLSVISGHRDTHFTFLRDLTPGMVIRITRADGTGQDYRVAEVRVVDEAGTRIARIATGRPRLLLTTCFPFDAVLPGGPQRFLVLAESI